jgi:hypothetical protein
MVPAIIQEEAAPVQWSAVLKPRNDSNLAQARRGKKASADVDS